MFTVRLHRDDGIQLVFAAHSYVLAPNYVNITRYDANHAEETVSFFVDPAVTPNYKRIEITNASGFKVDGLSAIPKETQQQIEAAVPQAAPNEPTLKMRKMAKTTLTPVG